MKLLSFSPILLIPLLLLAGCGTAKKVASAHQPEGGQFTPLPPASPPAPAGTVKRVSPDGKFGALPVPSASAPAAGETAHDFLLGSEQAGYGLYSYLLFGVKASESVPAARARNLAVAKVFLSMAGTLSATSSNKFTKLDKANLNVTYIPMRMSPATGIPETGWLLENYNYARARKFLDRLAPELKKRHLIKRERLGNGPYLVSVNQPLSQSKGAIDHVLFMDLSWVPENVAAIWTRLFLDQGAQVEFWKERTAQERLLRLRSEIEVAAIADVQVQQTFHDGVRKWLKEVVHVTE